MQIIALSLGRIMIPSIHKAIMDLELIPVANELFRQLGFGLDFSVLRWVSLIEPQ